LGAEVIAIGRIPADDVLAAVEALESADAWADGPQGGLNMGLIGDMARTAVIAGTATAVSNRVSRRQANRRATQGQQQYEAQAYQPHAYQPTPQASGATDMVQQLQKLGEPKAAGVLTEEEFAAQKARILAQ
jgi:Short C-terminal domain